MKVIFTNGQIIETMKRQDELGIPAEEWVCPICGEECWVYTDEWHIQNCHAEDFWCEHVSHFE